MWMVYWEVVETGRWDIVERSGCLGECSWGAISGPQIFLSFSFSFPVITRWVAFLCHTLLWWCSPSPQTQSHGANRPLTENSETMSKNKPFFIWVVFVSYFGHRNKKANTVFEERGSRKVEVCVSCECLSKSTHMKKMLRKTKWHLLSCFPGFPVLAQWAYEQRSHVAGLVAHDGLNNMSLPPRTHLVTVSAECSIFKQQRVFLSF